MRKRYSEEQTIKAIKRHETGSKAGGYLPGAGVSSGTIYIWRSKYADLEANEAKRLRGLESENTKVKKATGREAAGG